MSSDRVLHGVDASRRAGWRRYYEVDAENKTLRDALASPSSDRLRTARVASTDALREAVKAWVVNGGPVYDQDGASVEFLVHAEHTFWEIARGLGIPNDENLR